MKSELVKLDVLINKEEVDALSFIIHADTAYERGRKDVREVKRRNPGDSYSRFQSRQQSEVRSSRVKQFVRCVKTCWQNVMVEISAVRESFWKNRKKERNVCVRWAT